MRILVAEDDRITRVSLTRQLAAWGHQVTESPDGQAALKLFGEGAYDMVITDWEMPHLSGVELVERIRQADRAEYVYVIMLTSRSEKGDVVRGIEAGADDFVSKPFDREELRVRMLAGERIVRLEHALRSQNAQLREAGEKIRRDLDAAARVQRAMLPRQNIDSPRAAAAWAYEPTEELAGDAIGLHMIDDRYLVAYVIDVSGHGVPAALLSVTAMHYLEPEPENASLLRDMTRSGGLGSVRNPALVAAELNRRFSSDKSDDRFLTMVLCVLDTVEGRLAVTSAGHPMPIVLREGQDVPVEQAGGLPIAMFDFARYGDTTIQLRVGDRVCLFSDGIIEQAGASDEEFGRGRLLEFLRSRQSEKLDDVVSGGMNALAAWAGQRRFTDDVSLVVLEWK